ncbi:MAG TPA: AI-2E family transporter [Stellaceae bacterium]|nr:AI-2E family transporter [Stellaceae bacterium]
MKAKGGLAAVVSEPPAEASKEGLTAVQQSASSWNITSLLLAGIFSLMFFYFLYVAREIVVPTVIAFILNLLMQPVMKVFARLRVPKHLAAILAICLLLSLLAGFGYTLAGPAAAWLAKAPESLPRLEHHLAAFERPFEAVLAAAEEVQRFTGAPTLEGSPVAVSGAEVGWFLFSGTRAMMTGFGTAIVLLFFLLVSGELFLRRLVELLPTLSDKKQIVEISYEIERNISLYLVTATLMNAVVGVATGIATWLCGLPDPLLWGAVAFALNYILILGPLTNLAILLLVGLLTYDSLSWALVPAAAYLVIHLIEGETITPHLMARRFTLNPVLIILSLVFWYWMWGAVGALLAVPLLAMFKIVCDRIEPLTVLGHLLDGEKE